MATEYSVLATVPFTMAVVSYDLYKEWNILKFSDFGFFAVGFVVSFIAAAAVIKSFIALFQPWSLAPYSWYRMIIAPIIYLGMR